MRSLRECENIEGFYALKILRYRCRLYEKDLGDLLKALSHPRNQQITTLKNESLDEILLNLENLLHQKPQISAFTDLAAFLKGMSNIKASN